MPGTRNSLRSEVRRRHRLASDTEARVRLRWGRVAALVSAVFATGVLWHMIGMFLDRL